MVDLLFKWALLMIRFLIFSNRGLLFLLKDCLNVVIIWNLKPILLYYLVHILSIIFLSHFWWSVHVFSMVYIQQTVVVVSSEDPTHLVEILFHLSVYPTSRRCLMMLAHYWTHNLFGYGVRNSTNLEEQVLCLPLWSCPLYLCHSAPGRGYNVTLFVDLNYICLLDVVKLILNSRDFLNILSLESLKTLYNLIYGPTLSWLMYFSTFFINFQLSHLSLVIIFSVILIPSCYNTSVYSWKFDLVLFLLSPWMQW